MGEGWSSRVELDGEDIQIHDNYCNTLTCLENSFLMRHECSFSCHEIEYNEDVESLKGHFPEMEEGRFIEDQILKHLEESIEELIIGAIHCEMMVMSGPQYNMSPHEPNEFLEEDVFSKYSQGSLGLYNFVEVHSQPTSFSHDAFYFKCDHKDGTWNLVRELFRGKVPITLNFTYLELCQWDVT